MLNAIGVDYLLETAELPAHLEHFLPGVDTVTLHLDETPAALGEAELEGGGCALVAGDEILLAFPALEELPVEDIDVMVGQGGEVYGLAPLSAP